MVNVILVAEANWHRGLRPAESRLSCRLGWRRTAGVGRSKILPVDLVAKAALDRKLERILELGVTVEHAI
jgi:hypothetical protein